jgi:energy-coupling factor transport system substrate-specific component
MVAMLAGLVTALVSFPVDYFYGYLNEVAGWNLLTQLHMLDLVKWHIL